MIVSFKHGVCFFATPRTGSHSIAQWLMDEGDARYFGGHHGRDVPSEFAHFTSVAAVRNPYSRAVSFWRHVMSRPGDELYEICGGDQPFESFVVWLAAKKPGFPVEWNSQHSFLAGLRIDHLLRYETLREDFSALPFVQATGKTELPWINRTDSFIDWREYYQDPRLTRYVITWASRDFVEYRYSQDINAENEGITGPLRTTPDRSTQEGRGESR